ncbi:antitoxin Xre/MbcA/ParS toxin-binding domain-containing protein [Pseudomonas aeruginosa]
MSPRTIQRLSRLKKPVRLPPRQSAIALQYARTLEQALTVFGTIDLAGTWLSRPCNRLDGEVPLNIVDNSLGFRAVRDYLGRIEYGLYP